MCVSVYRVVYRLSRRLRFVRVSVYGFETVVTKVMLKVCKMGHYRVMPPLL